MAYKLSNLFKKSVSFLQVFVAVFNSSLSLQSPTDAAANRYRKSGPFVSHQMSPFSSRWGQVPHSLSSMAFLLLTSLPQNAGIPSEAVQDLRLKFPSMVFLVPVSFPRKHKTLRSPKAHVLVSRLPLEDLVTSSNLLSVLSPIAPVGQGEHLRHCTSPSLPLIRVFALPFQASPVAFPLVSK